MAIIDKPSDYFNTKLYTGDGASSHAISGVGFQSDLTWIKNRNSALNHALTDSVRGAPTRLMSNTTDGDINQTTGLLSFNSDGFTVGADSGYNGNGNSIVSWNWKAGGTAVSNTDGSITSSVSANQDAGFSIVSFTGNATAGATIGHGLNSVPSLILTKNRDSAYNWHLWTHAFSSYNDTIQLNTTAAKDTGTLLNNTAPTSSLITLGSSAVLNASGEKIIAYVFSEKQGYSKFGSYTGNGSTDGTFVYTGFKPAWVMSKRTDSSGNSWRIFDTKRPGFNTSSMNFVHANLSNAENTGDVMDLNSNGFKIRTNSTDQNTSGSIYIYMAFAEAPFVTSTGVPATAR